MPWQYWVLGLIAAFLVYRAWWSHTIWYGYNTLYLLYCFHNNVTPVPNANYASKTYIFLNALEWNVTAFNHDRDELDRILAWAKANPEKIGNKKNK
jgi:hypothetical protein